MIEVTHARAEWLLSQKHRCSCKREALLSLQFHWKRLKLETTGAFRQSVALEGQVMKAAAKKRRAIWWSCESQQKPGSA